MSALTVQGRKVIVSRDGVASFNRGWPCSTLRASRAYWFEFDSSGDLIDTDCPESDDGPASAAMAGDCKAFLFDDVRPDWAPDVELIDMRFVVVAMNEPRGFGGGWQPCTDDAPGALFYPQRANNPDDDDTRDGRRTRAKAQAECDRLNHGAEQ